MTPLTPGLTSLLPNLNTNNVAALNTAILNKPTIVPEFLQNNPSADTRIDKLFSEMTAFRKSPMARKEWQNLYVDNQFQNLAVLAHGAGAPGASVAITLAPASFQGDSAMAFESYEYFGYSSITNTSFTGFVDFGDITYTSGAWVLTMSPTLDGTGVIPAQALGDPLRLLQPVTVEGNTTHLASGRTTSIYSETKRMQIQERQKIEVTDLLSMSDNAWATAKVDIDGKVFTTNMWSNRDIDLGIKQWHNSDCWGRLHGSGEMRETDPRGRNSSEGLWHWIEFSGGNLLTFTGTITDTDIETWNQVLADNYEDVGEYIIMSGRNVSSAIQLWARGGHIAGQRTQLEQSNFSVDFKKFTYNDITYHIPIKPFSEFNNQFGHAAFGYEDKALFLPVGKTTTVNSVGDMVPFIEWMYASNNNPTFDGLEGADHMWWELGPPFWNMDSSGQKVIKIQDNVARVAGYRVEGSNFKKAQVFAILQP